MIHLRSWKMYHSLSEDADVRILNPAKFSKTEILLLHCLIIEVKGDRHQ